MDGGWIIVIIVVIIAAIIWIFFPENHSDSGILKVTGYRNPDNAPEAESEGIEQESEE